MSEQRSYRYYEFVMAAFVTVLICSNLIGPAKIAQLELPLIGSFVLGAGALFFPISYVFGDILTEVYGYARARRVIWAGFAGLAFASFMAAVVVALPPAPFWKHQAAYEVAFGSTWRIVAASMIGWKGLKLVAMIISPNLSHSPSYWPDSMLWHAGRRWHRLKRYCELLTWRWISLPAALGVTATTSSSSRGSSGCLNISCATLIAW